MIGVAAFVVVVAALDLSAAGTILLRFAWVFACCAAAFAALTRRRLQEDGAQQLGHGDAVART